eukprot:COSAG02_NODE_5079_length_4659_cov_2.238596_2_plen_66_part_00
MDSTRKPPCIATSASYNWPDTPCAAMLVLLYSDPVAMRRLMEAGDRGYDETPEVRHIFTVRSNSV